MTVQQLIDELTTLKVMYSSCDGMQVEFVLPEIDESFGENEIIVTVVKGEERIEVTHVKRDNGRIVLR